MAVDWRCWPGIGHHRPPNTMIFFGSIGVSVTLREAIECPFYVSWSGAKGLKPSWPYVIGRIQWPRKSESWGPKKSESCGPERVNPGPRQSFLGHRIYSFFGPQDSFFLGHWIQSFLDPRIHSFPGAQDSLCKRVNPGVQKRLNPVAQRE